MNQVSGYPGSGTFCETINVGQYISMDSKDASIRNLFLTCEPSDYNICVNFKKPSEAIVDFLAQQGFRISLPEKENHFMLVRKISDMRKIIKIVSENNQVPPKTIESILKKIEANPIEKLETNYKKRR